MRKGLARVRGIIFNLGLLFALIILFLNLSAKYRSPNSARDSSNVIKHKQVLPPSDGPFVWSDKIQDWAISRSFDIDGRPEATNQPEGQDCLWPESRVRKQCSKTDRIINQLKLDGHEPDKFFKISIANDFTVPIGQEPFIDDKCEVNRCVVTRDLDDADAIVFPNADVFNEPSKSRRINQIWIAHLLESPPNTFDRRFARRHRGKHEFNWTASYRSDSDIVTPYAKYVPYLTSEQPNPNHRLDASSEFHALQHKHRIMIAKKQTKVAWFVSNCHAKNRRLEFAHELAKYIQVDIYGKCGNLTCNKSSQTDCLRLMNRDYKFYLAFENSNNREYITEKLYRNAYGYNDKDHLMIPIVMGPRREDYEKLVPPASFIHVNDFKSAKDLAKFLKLLTNDDALYYSYFRWKTMGRFIDTKFLCRLCSMLHNSHKIQRIKVISDIENWWWLDEDKTTI